VEAAQAKNPVVLEDLDKLIKQLDALRKDRDQRKLTVTELLAEIDKLKVKLDTTPAYVPPPGIAIRLPNPKPMPEQAELQRVLVSEGKLHFLKEKEFAKVVEEELKNGNSDYTTRRETVKGPDGKPVMKKGSTGQPAPVRKLTFDPTKMANTFNKANLGNRDVKVEVVQIPNSPNIQINVLPRPTGGETVEQARKMSSVFRSQLHALKANPKAVIWFHVCKDSIPAYLAPVTLWIWTESPWAGRCGTSRPSPRKFRRNIWWNTPRRRLPQPARLREPCHQNPQARRP
jgi:hypothetical protein